MSSPVRPPGPPLPRPPVKPVPLPRSAARRVLPVPRFAQPDAVTCGPTCLAQVMAYYGDLRPIGDLAAAVRRNPDGGTMAVYLAHLALELGYRVRLYPLGVRVFDPTWWELQDEQIVAKLAERAAGLSDPAERDFVLAWRDYMLAGGMVAFVEPGPAVLVRILDKGRPIICGLNSTWLYREARDNPDTNQSDDVHGEPVGHFVTLVGYTGEGRHFHVNDPSEDAPFAAGGDPDGPHSQGRYPLPADRLIHAILLGDGTRDAILLELWPPFHPHRKPAESP